MNNRIGLWQAVSIAVSTVIGASVFSVFGLGVLYRAVSKREILQREIVQIETEVNGLFKHSKKDVRQTKRKEID